MQRVKIDYRTCMSFRRYHIELAACSDGDKERTPILKTAPLRSYSETVNDTFHAAGYELDKTDAVCRTILYLRSTRLQGRLDHMQRICLYRNEIR